MKKCFSLIISIFPIALIAQTAITDSNFREAINVCLETNPVDGMCSASIYGAMPDWDVSQVTKMDSAFYGRQDFNADVGQWDVSNVTNVQYMFAAASDFNRDISQWDVSNVTNMQYMFAAASDFNGDISQWDVSQVTDMKGMFSRAQLFNNDLSSWDVSNVIDMSEMFAGNYNFNFDLSTWNVSNVEDMSYMFVGTERFNGDISQWDVSNVKNMSSMFQFADNFNGDISQWDVSNVTNMNFMFWKARAFGGDISQWDVSNVTTLRLMFARAFSFNKDISTWDISNVIDMVGMLSFSGISTQNYDSILLEWSQQNVMSDVTLSAEGISYCIGEDARQRLIDNYNWTIIDAGLNCTTSTHDLETIDVVLYPNPVSDFLYIQNNGDKTFATIFDNIGKEILSQNVNNAIDMSHLQSGVYILQLRDQNKMSAHQIVKE
jgi:surface protein